MTDEFIRTLIATVAAALIAALGISVSLWLLDRWNSAPVALLTPDLQVVRGAANLDGTELRVTAMDEEGVVMFISPLGSGLPAKRHSRLRWRVSEYRRAEGYALIWVTDDQPQSLQSLPLSPDQFLSGQIDLQSDPRWRSDVVGVGFALTGVSGFPLRIASMELDNLSSQWGWQDANRQLLLNSVQFAPWLPASINFYRAVEERTWTSPVVLVTLWVLISLVLMFVMSKLSSMVSWSTAGMILLVGGWLLLDLRWSADLLQRVRGSPVDVASYLKPGANAWLTQLSNRLGEVPTRVFLIDDNPSGARALRARYLLSPHSTLLGFADLPDPGILRRGDAILILSAPVAIRFDSNRRVLYSSSGREIEASLLSTASEIGFAFAVERPSVAGAAQ